jgi:hypothetical protein
MMTGENYGAHSAEVEMRLIVIGESIPITHMASDYLLVKYTRDYPAGRATIMMRVDESKSQWDVMLPNGISKDSKRVALALAE